MYRATILLFALALATAACKPKEEATVDNTAKPTTEAPAPTAPTQAEAPTPAAEGVGTIVGKITLAGEAPKMADLDRKSDPFCAKTKKIEPYVRAAGGNLQDVLVRLPVGAAKGAPAAPAVVSQHECMYEPFVTGVMTGESVIIKNADKTTHNIHTYDGDETLFNEAQPPGAPDLNKTVESDGGTVIKFQCDVHKWMQAHVVVTDHPFFAVSGADGSYKIEKVPAGEYELEAWHPYLGVQKVKVDVKKDATAEIAFTFKAADYNKP